MIQEATPLRIFLPLVLTRGYSFRERLELKSRRLVELSHLEVTLSSLARSTMELEQRTQRAEGAEPQVDRTHKFSLTLDLSLVVLSISLLITPAAPYKMVLQSLLVDYTRTLKDSSRHHPLSHPTLRALEQERLTLEPIQKVTSL